MGQQQPLLASIRGNIGDARGRRLGDFRERRMARLTALGRHAELVGGGGRGAAEAHDEIFLSVPDQPANSEDLAATQLEIDVVRRGGAESPGLQDNLVGRMRDMGRKQVLRIATNHQPHEAVGIETGQRTIRADGAVLQDRHVIAEVEDLIEPVRNVEDGDALVAKIANELHQHRHIRGGERRGRLVQDEHARFDEQSLGDLDDLPSAERQLADRSVQGLLKPELGADGLNGSRQTVKVDQPAAAIVGAKADVLGDGEMSGETQLLLHDGHAPAMGFTQG